MSNPLQGRNGLLWLLASVVLVYALWSTPILYPLKMAVVFFHELSHGIGGLLSGGEIVEINLSAQQGGRCLVRGGNSLLVAASGYVGSALWGALILILAGRTRWDRIISALLGLLLVFVALVYVRPLLSFGALFTLASGLAMLGLSRWGNEAINDFCLRVFGVTSIIYAPLDVQSDIFERPWLRSDAVILEELTGVPRMVWGAIWMLLSLVVAALGLWLSVGKREPTPIKAPGLPT